MALRFKFSGGVTKPTFHQTEKFLLFFVVGGREVPMYQMLRDGLVVKVKEGGDEYQTSNNVMKVFVLQSGFGIPKRYHSFYFRLVALPSAIVTILPFSGVKKDGFFFEGTCKFLSKSQITVLLDKEGESQRFVARQEALPLDTLRSMVRVDKSVLKKGVRCIRVGS